MDLEELERLAEQGDSEAAYKLGNIYYDGKQDKTGELEDWLSSDKVREFELKNKVNPQQEHDLLFCAVLMTQNWESVTMLPVSDDKAKSARLLQSSWSINDKKGAIDTCYYLSMADNHTRGLDNKYKAIRFADELKPYSNKEFETAKQMLMGFGYNEEELMLLPTLAAWDYGRCGFIARYAVSAGYMAEATAWEHISRCAENAADRYDSWRQYLAAYVLGRALWGSDCLDLKYVLAYLLCSSNSPFKRGIEIKPGYKDNFDFHYAAHSIEPDHAEAVKWYRKAAELGNAKAQCDLGYCYDKGDGVAQDYSEAISWYRKAAEQGDATAQYNLGQCYKNGKGMITKDLKLAREWYSKAAKQGYEDAEAALEKLPATGRGKMLKVLLYVVIAAVAMIAAYLKSQK